MRHKRAMGHWDMVIFMSLYDGVAMTIESTRARLLAVAIFLLVSRIQSGFAYVPIAVDQVGRERKKACPQHSKRKEFFLPQSFSFS